MNRKNIRHVLFWIKSHKGTDEKAVFKIPNSWTKKDIKSALEKWCFGFSAWTHEENTMHYGWKSINVPDKKGLKKKYDLACRSKARIFERWKILAAMFNIKKTILSLLRRLSIHIRDNKF